MSEQMKAPAQLLFYKEHVEIKKFAVFKTEMSQTTWCTECFLDAWEATRTQSFVLFVLL